MALYKYQDKDKFIRIFKAIKKRVRIEERSSIEGIRTYMHPLDMKLRAYVRQLSASERFSSNAHQDSRDYEIVINYREGIDVDCYIEYDGRTLKVTGVDGYDLKKTELKLRAHEEEPGGAIDEDEE